MKNSEEFLRPELRSKLSAEQLKIIDGIQFGSRHVLKEKVYEAAMQMYETNQKKERNTADGGDGGPIFIAARHMDFSGSIEAKGGNAGPGGMPGRGGPITLISESIKGKPTIDASGGTFFSTSPETPWYKTWWGIFLEVLFAAAAIVAIIEFFRS